LKTIATFSTPEEAHLFRTRLEAASIPAYVLDEYIVQLNWTWSNAVGGVRVQVSDDDLSSAREFLAEDTPQKAEDAVAVVCPCCGSDQTAPNELYRRLAYLTLLIFQFPMLFGWKRWRCKACRQGFQP
jgi:hypothetical protein